MNSDDFLSYAIPIAAAIFAPYLEIPSALGAGVAAGGIETLRSGNLGRGVLSGLMAGGLGSMMGGLGAGAEGAAAAEPAALGNTAQVAEPAWQGINTETGETYTDVLGQQAAQQQAQQRAMPLDKIMGANGSDWMNAAFPKGAGLFTPGGMAGIGALGTASLNASDAQMAQYKAQLASREEARAARQAHIAGLGNGGATPYPGYNYIDPMDYLFSGRSSPFTRG